ncbi:MAG: response regulator transcription factor [Actinomycetota bacterium]
MQLLVVEEHQIFADALGAFLNSQDDMEVVGIALSTGDALDLAIERRPDVITTSDRLPDGDGLDLVAMLRDKHSEARVIMVGSPDDEEVVAAALDAGCVGFVPKAGRLTDLATAARTAMAGRVAIPSKVFARALNTLQSEPGRQAANLTPLELEILKLFPKGLPNSAIGAELGLSERSIRNHVESILTKLESHSKLQGLATAIRRGIIFLVLP